MTTLRDLLLDSRDGEWGKADPAPSRRKMSVIRGTDFPAVRIGEVSNIPQRYLEERHAHRKRVQVWDLIIETAGGSPDKPTGRTIILKPSLFEKLGPDVTCASFARFLRIDPKRAEPHYVFWLLQYFYERRELLQFHTQHTGVARFQFTTFADTFRLELPDQRTQRRIASILGTYDDLIEVNSHRIAVLEEMARRLFDEWFVRPLADSYPMGWKNGVLGDLLTLAYGRALKAADRRPGEVPVIGSSGVIGLHNEALVRRPGVVVGRKGNVGSVIWSPTSFYPIDTVFYVESTYPPRFLVELLRRMPFQNGDAAVPGLNRAAALKLPVVIPQPELITKYAEAVEPMMSFVDQLRSNIERLAASRDLLLARLISGDLSVAAAERALEAAE